MSLSNTEDLAVYLRNSRFEDFQRSITDNTGLSKRDAMVRSWRFASLIGHHLDMTCPRYVWGKSDPNLGHLESSVSFICT